MIREWFRDFVQKGHGVAEPKLDSSNDDVTLQQVINQLIGTKLLIHVGNADKRC